MKKNYTQLLILYFCILGTAYGINPTARKITRSIPPDTTTARHSQDSTKASSNGSIKLITDLLIRDNTILLAPVSGDDSLKLPLTTLLPDTANMPARRLIDSIRVSAAAAESPATPPTEDYTDGLKRLTSGLQLDSLRASVIAAQIEQQRLKQQLRREEQAKLAWVLKINDPDSLKSVLKHADSDTLRGLIYTHLAGFYLRYDTISNKKQQLFYQNEAINYTLQAIKQYAAYDDSTALRLSFDNLARVYYSQRKYPQAKWFILQSNTLSRAKNDTSNIISSLLTLSSIKSDIKDYSLAMRDLNEALQLSVTTHQPKTQLQVLKNYAMLYSRLKDYPKEALILKKRDLLQDSIRRAEEAQLAAQNASQKKKLDSLQNKKKVYTSGMRKLYKNNSSRKIASL